MKVKLTMVLLGLMALSFLPSLAVAVEAAPHITDREIIERLTRLEEGQKNLEKRIDDLRLEMNNRFSDMNSRFDTLQWMLGLFISIALVLFGFMFRMQWQMQKRQAHMETALETQKDELAFLKGLIHKLLPPKGVL
jgi:DNA-binding GntR family transcriptional regulator